jgi:hypothetical protein
MTSKLTDNINTRFALSRLVLISCLEATLLGFAQAAPISVLPTGQLQVSDVQSIIAQAVTQAVHDNVEVVVAVSDREGRMLGVWDMNPVPRDSLDDKLDTVMVIKLFHSQVSLRTVG